MTMRADDSRLGRLAYEGYCTATGGVSLISGQSLPPWEELDSALQNAWISAALNVAVNLV